MKIRSGGGISEASAKALGASPLVKPAPESYEILSSGVADGTFFPSESIKSFNLDKVVKYATFFPGGFYSSSFGFFMNQDKWNKLSKQDQDAIMSVSGEALARLAGKAWDAADKVGLEAMKAAGVQIIEASPAFVADVRQRTAPLVQDWIKSANAKGVDGAKAYAEFHDELKKVAAGKLAARRQPLPMRPALPATRAAALTRSAWILADEGHESGLAGQLTARGPRPDTFWTLPLGLAFDEAEEASWLLIDDSLDGARRRRLVRHPRAESGDALPPLGLPRAPRRRGDRPHPSAGGLGAGRGRAAADRRPHGRDAAVRRHRLPARLARPADRRPRRRADRRRPRRASTRCCSPTTACSPPAARCRRRPSSPSSSSGWRASRSTPRKVGGAKPIDAGEARRARDFLRTDRIMGADLRRLVAPRRAAPAGGGRRRARARMKRFDTVLAARAGRDLGGGAVR